MVDENKQSLFEPVDNNAGTANMDGNPQDAKRLIKFTEELIANYEKQWSTEQYLSNLAKKNSADKPQHFLNIRSIVLDAHLALDTVLSGIIALLIVIGCRNYRIILNEPESIELTDYINEKMQFYTRLEMVSKLKIFSQKVLKIFEETNNVRNAFAHGRDITHKSYNYYKESIFEENTIKKLDEDIKLIFTEAKQYFRSLFGDTKEKK